MDVNAIIDMAIDQAHVNTDDYPRSRVIKYLNIVKNDFRSAQVAELGEDYDWETFTTSSSANQTEYVLPVMSSSESGIKKVRGLSIKYNGTDYVKAREVKPTDMKEHWSFYQKNQSSEDPIYYIADNSFFIAPLVTTDIDNCFELKGLKNIPDYTEDGNEASIFFPVDTHEVLVQGTLAYILRSQGKGKEFSFEKTEYIRLRDEYINTLSNRNTGPTYLSYPEEREESSDISL